MKLRERDEGLDPRAERELAAVDRALAGDPVDPDLADWAELTDMLSDERPESEPGWTAELDERAARSFRPEGGGGSSWRAFADRLGALAPRRFAAPAGALATLAIVAVVALSTLDSGSTDESVSSTSGEAAAGAPAQESTTSEEPASAGAQPVTPQLSTEGSSAADAGLSAIPEVIDPDSASYAFRRDAGRVAPGTEKRQVERDVRMELSAQPDEVRGVTDEAIAITRGLDGIVTSSQVSEAGRQASASLELTIPTRNLDSAIDQLTELANVESLNETSLDITKPYISAQDRLEDAEAERQALLRALGNASTDAEAEALRLQIDDARREISRAESVFENLARRARLSQLALTITGNPGADASSSDDEGRTIGGWLDDTAGVLRDVAGVLLVTAAIVVPLAIVGALIWFAVAAVRRQRREGALDA